MKFDDFEANGESFGPETGFSGCRTRKVRYNQSVSLSLPKSKFFSRN